MVECRSCGARYEPSVLRTPTTAEQQAALGTAVRLAMAAVLGADGDPSEAALATARTELDDLGWTDAGTDVLRGEIATLDGTRVGPALDRIAPGLNELGRELLLRRFVRVAIADGPLSGTAGRWIGHIGAHLGMTPAHVRGVIAEVLEQTS